MEVPQSKDISADTKIQNGRRGIRGLKMRVGQECSINRGRARLYSEGIQLGGVRGRSHNVTSWDTAEGEAPRVRAAKCSEFEEGKL